MSVNDEPSPSIASSLAEAEAMPDGVDKVRALSYALMPIFAHPTEESFALARRIFAVARSIGDRRGMAYGIERIGQMHQFRGNYPIALRYLRRALKMFESLEESVPWLPQTLQATANSYSGVGRYADALKYFQRAIDAGRERGDLRGAAAALAGMGEVYRFLGDHHRALSLVMESIPLWEELEDPRGLGVVYNNIAIIHCAMKNPESALADYTRSLEYYRSAGSRDGEAIALGNIGLVYSDNGQPERGRECMLQSLAINRELGFRRHEAGVLVLLAEATMRQGGGEEALGYLREAQRIYEEIEFRSGLCEVLGGLGEALHGLGRIAEAVEVLNRGRALAAELNYRRVLGDCDRLLALCHEQQQDLRTALEHYREYMKMYEALSNEEAKRAIVSMEVRMETERTERDRQILRMQAERLEREVHMRTQELEAVAVRLAQKSELLANVRRQVQALAGAGDSEAGVAQLLRRIDAERDADTTWGQFTAQMEQIHPGLMTALHGRFADLSPTELKVCTLLRSNLNSKDIANILNLSVHTVDTHRRRIRKKLGLTGATNLTTFLMEVA